MVAERTRITFDRWRRLYAYGVFDGVLLGGVGWGSWLAVWVAVAVGGAAAWVRDCTVQVDQPDLAA